MADGVLVLAMQLAARVPGGTGRYTQQLILALSREAPAPSTVTALISRDAISDELQVPVPTRRIGLPSLVLSRLWERRLPPTVGWPGIVHAPTLLVPRVGGAARLVVTIHDVVPWSHPETLTARGVAFHRRMADRAAAEASLIVTPTAAVAAQLTKTLNPRCPILPVAPGVTIAPVPADAAERRSALGATDDYLLFVGTAEPRKGLDVLVEALSRAELRDRRLVVAGPPGWGDVQVADLARRHGVADRVVITGRLSESDLSAVYAGAGAVVVPSRAEGFGFPVVEGMAHGRPVVVSADPALVEVSAGAAPVVAIGDAGGLAAAAATVLADGVERRQAIRRGHARAADFSWTRTADEMWRLYRGVGSG